MREAAISIGTRDSLLAQWQSKLVSGLLAENNFDSHLVLIKSEGDINLITPLYEMGVQGIFTKTLDAALLDKRIDVAVHSYKDIPTKLAAGLKIAAVLKRGNAADVLVCRNSQIYDEVAANLNSDTPLSTYPFTIATSSSRRIAQWLHRYPESAIENLRGNVNTRLSKLNDSSWHGAIFAAAGLERLNINNRYSIELNWMLPAPAQGAIAIVCREDDEEILKACAPLDDHHTRICTSVEKDFLRALMGGCSTPIAAFAEIKNEEIHFEGNILSPDGKQMISDSWQHPLSEYSTLGNKAASEILNKGGKTILNSFPKGVV